MNHAPLQIEIDDEIPDDARSVSIRCECLVSGLPRVAWYNWVSGAMLRQVAPETIRRVLEAELRHMLAPDVLPRDFRILKISARAEDQAGATK